MESGSHFPRKSVEGMMSRSESVKGCSWDVMLLTRPGSRVALCSEGSWRHERIEREEGKPAAELWMKGFSVEDIG